MINKIKDFLKNRLKRNRTDDLSDQDLNEIDHGEDFEQDQAEFDAENSELPLIDLSVETTKPSIKERLTGTLHKIQIPKLRVSEWKKPKLGLPQKKTATAVTLSPGISRWSEQFLSRSSRESIHQGALVLLICGITYTIGKVTALALKGSPVEAPRRYEVAISLDEEFNPRELQMVRTINLFRTNAAPGKKLVADTKCEKAQQKSNLPITLVNTVVLQDSVKSLASVQVRGGRDIKELREGDQIDNMAKIFRIDRLELLVKNLESGVCESIGSNKLNQGRGSPISVMSPSQSRDYLANKKISGIENQGNKFSIQKSLLNEKLKDIGTILTQARAVKIQNPDGSMSFKMTELDPEGIFPYLGLQDGDIITTINGKPIFDLNEVMSLFGRIKNIDNLQLGIKRDGSESVQEYKIK